MHPCTGDRVAIGRAVVYYARAAHAFSAGIKCRHCRYGQDNKTIINTIDGNSELRNYRVFIL